MKFKKMMESVLPNLEKNDSFHEDYTNFNQEDHKDVSTTMNDYLGPTDHPLNVSSIKGLLSNIGWTDEAQSNVIDVALIEKDDYQYVGIDNVNYTYLMIGYDEVEDVYNVSRVIVSPDGKIIEVKHEATFDNDELSDAQDFILRRKNLKN